MTLREMLARATAAEAFGCPGCALKWRGRARRLAWRSGRRTEAALRWEALGQLAALHAARAERLEARGDLVEAGGWFAAARDLRRLADALRKRIEAARRRGASR